ncbi:MAG: Ig-like domain-containing protein [Eubacteriales bacterium]|nr:Ig-like domain-containing protein [Eubacteriales bacterium]
MSFGKKWIAISLTAAMLAANLSAPLTSLTALADETVIVEDSREDGEDLLLMEDGFEETVATDADSLPGEADQEAAAREAEVMDQEHAGGQDQDTAEPVEVSTEGAEDLQKDSSSSDSDAGGTEQNAVPDGTDSAAASDAADPAEDGGDIFYTDQDDTAGSSGAASSSAQSGEGEAAATEDPVVTDPGDPGQADVLIEDPAMEEGEELPDGLLITEEGISETFVPVEDGIENTDNDDVFAAYVNREMGLDGDLKADTGDYNVSEPRKRSHYVSRTLSEYNLKVYAVLLKQIKEVAAGNRTNTVFTVTPGDLGLEGSAWTAEELGVDAVVVKNPETGEYSLTAEAKEAMYSLLGISFKTVNKALLADCPYDLYWYDKTFGSNASGFRISGRSSGGVWRLFFTGEYTFQFPVAAEYSDEGIEGTYTTDPTTGQAVETARTKALAIVHQYADCSDYEKLDGYRAEICALTSYNRSAADDTTATPYGNPWQLIWTFDGDDSTKVVCEGYAKSFQYLCDLSSWTGIFKECISVTGYMDGGTGAGGHMWNIVTLRDNRNYLVDITNCDSGTIGSGNNGRNLFLVGTGGATASEVFAQGNAAEGYTFAKLGNLQYTYDSNAVDRFGNTILTLSPGRVDASTTATGEYTGSHDHIYLPAEEKEATCSEEGHSAGEECVICGEINPKTTTVIQKIPHTPGTWNVCTNPSYDAPGEEVTNCTVCSETITREIPAWISESEITLSDAQLTLEKGDSETITATVLPAEAHDRSVTWSSDNEAVAAVSSAGEVTAVGSGTTTIHATTNHLNLTASCEVTVTAPVISLQSVTLPEEILVKRDQTVKIDYQLVPADATEKEIVWSSDNQAVAVAEKGEVTGVESGTAKITASKPDGTLLGDCTVRVVVPVEEIKLDTTSLKLWTGDSQNIHYTIGPSVYSENINLNFAYFDYPSEYSREKVFDFKTFAGGAEVEALAPGTGTITYTLETETGNTFTDSCAVEVLQEISSFALDQSALSLTAGDRQNLSAQVLPADASARVVSWTSSDESIVKVTPANSGLLDQTAENTASIEAVSCGTATVQAVITEETRSGSVTHTETCAVTVDPVPLGKVLTEDKETSGVTIASAGGLVYTGSALKPAVTVTCSGKTLQKDVDYKVSYQNNTAAGTAKVIITGCGSYSGTFEKTFTIGKASQTVTASNVTKTYGDSSFTLSARSNGDGALSYGSANTSVADINSKSGLVTIKGAGKAQITITAAATSNYSASAKKTITLTVNPRNLAAGGITLSTGTCTYNGKAQTPAVTVKSGTATLKKDTDYTLTYGSNTNAGTAKVTVAGKGNYTGTIAKTFTIAPAAQAITAKAAASSIAVGRTTTVSITGAKGTKSYKSSDSSVATVTSAGVVTAKKVGTVKITAAAAKTANYTAASRTVTIKIVPAATTKLSASNQAKGIKLTWARVAGANGYILYRNNKIAKTITSGGTLTWSDTAANTNGAKYVYKVVAKASTGTSPLSRSVTVYKISRPAIKTLKNNASKKMTVTWAKNASSTGYQIQYALNSSFTSGSKWATITKASTVSKVIGSLTKKKKYYVRIRTVKKAGNQNYYSEWSPVKTVTISR